MKNKIKTTFAILALILITVSAIFLSNKINKNTENLSAEDSNALYGGDLEYGYKSAGYLVNYQKNSTQRRSCGVAVINNSQAITAGHCVDSAEAIFIGEGFFKDKKSDFLAVNKINLKQNWIKSRNEEDDIAVLFYTNDNKFNTFASIIPPKDGCNYHIVAYGRSDDTPNMTLPRKGADICISNITNKTFRIIGANNSGICFGDSGSPIYEKDSNKLVGIISSIVMHPNSDPKDVCNIGNTGLAIRADSTSELITSNSLNKKEDLVTISNLAKVPSDANLFDKIGLNQEIDLKDPHTQYTIAIISIIITAFGIIIIWIRR